MKILFEYHIINIYLESFFFKFEIIETKYTIFDMIHSLTFIVIILIIHIISFIIKLSYNENKLEIKIFIKINNLNNETFVITMF